MKKLLKLLVVLLLLVLLAGVAGYVFIDHAAKVAVERGGTYALGVETELGSADVGLLRGHLGLSALRVANPRGFEQPDFLSLAKGEMDLDMASLRADTLVVPRLLLEGITLDLARNESGTNFGVILEHLERFETRKKDEPPAEEEGRKVLIQEIVIRDVGVTIDLGQSLAGFQKQSFQVPEIVLTEVGTGGEGKTVSEHFSTILKALLAAVLERGGGLIPPELLADLEGRLAELEALPERLREEIEGQLDEAVDGALRDLEEKKGQLPGGLQDLLKKKDGK